MNFSFIKTLETFSTNIAADNYNKTPKEDRILLSHHLAKIQITTLMVVDDKIWLVSFMDYDIGYFDEETQKV